MDPCAASILEWIPVLPPKRFISFSGPLICHRAVSGLSDSLSISARTMPSISANLTESTTSITVITMDHSALSSNCIGNKSPASRIASANLFLMSLSRAFWLCQACTPGSLYTAVQGLLSLRRLARASPLFGDKEKRFRWNTCLYTSAGIPSEFFFLVFISTLYSSF